MLQGKRFGFNDEVIAATEGYFETKHKSFFTIAKLIQRLKICIDRNGDHDEK